MKDKDFNLARGRLKTLSFLNVGSMDRKRAEVAIKLTETLLPKLLASPAVHQAGDDFFPNTFAEQIWTDNYRDGSEPITSTMWRVAVAVMAGEKRAEYWTERLFLALISRRISFGGRVVANLASSHKEVSVFNCYGTQRNKRPCDSIEGIYEDLRIGAHILKTEGGVGFNFSHLRPRGTFIKGIGIGSPGLVKFMELYDKSSEIITEGHPEGDNFQVPENTTSKRRVRKGAMMGMLHVSHPEIYRFIAAKARPNTLTKFNMSVIVTDEFMRAVDHDENWDLWFPDINWVDYDRLWDGDFDNWKAMGRPIKVYQTVKARDLYKTMMEATYKRNEPGIYFIDAANRYNNLSAIQKITGTNPCGEIAMLGDPVVWKGQSTVGDICNLGHLNLPAYIDRDPYAIGRGEIRFNHEQFKADVELLVRALDNLIDHAKYPMEGLKLAARLRRKIGIGVMGYGSALYMMGMRYGSKVAQTWTEEILREKCLAEHTASALLAKEKGPFLLYDRKTFGEGGFIDRLPRDPRFNDIRDLIRKHGMRNAQLSTCAPTGGTGIFMGLVSGGMEPVFEKEYHRWVVESHRVREVCEGLEYPAFWDGDLTPTKDFRPTKVGDEDVLMTKDGVLMICRNHGLRRKVLCQDYGWAWCKHNLTIEEIDAAEKAGVFATARDLTVTDHVEPFLLFSRWVDNSISKTVNLPADFAFDAFQDLYFDIWRRGARGMTTYREGTMTAVLETKDESVKSVKKETKDFLAAFSGHGAEGVIFEDVELPSEYPARGYILKAEGKKWYLHVAFKDRGMTRPFAIFVSTNAKEPTAITLNALEVLESLSAQFGLPVDRLAEQREKYATQQNPVKIARVLGFLLRHNVPIADVVAALTAVECTAGSFVWRVRKFLSGFVPEAEMEKMLGRCKCGGELRMQEGCAVCSECGASKCG
jgi:ribonucleoside-diphosphate reductase alpha chain